MDISSWYEDVDELFGDGSHSLVPATRIGNTPHDTEDNEKIMH